MQKRALWCWTVFFLCLWTQTAVWSQATMSGKLLSVDGAKGLVTLQMDSGAEKVFLLTPEAQVKWFGEASTLSALPIGQKVAVRVCGALNDKPLQTDLVVDWNSSSAYVAKSAKAPYHTKVGDYATAGGASAPMPAGAGMNPSAAMQAPGSTVPLPGMQLNSNGQYVNQGAVLQAPLSATITQDAMSNPSMSTTGATPSIGQASGDPFGIGGSDRASAENSFTAMVVQVDGQRNTVTLQSQSRPQPFTVSLLQVEADPMALQVGTSVQVFGRSTPQGFVVEKIAGGQLQQPEF